MSVFYDASKECLKVNDVEETFYCGETLNKAAITLIQLREGVISLQQSYIEIEEYVRDSTLSVEGLAKALTELKENNL